MLKWVFVVLFVGIALSVVVNNRLQHVSGGGAVAPVATVARPAAVAVPAAVDHGRQIQSVRIGILSPEQERLQDRVPPVQEAPLKDDLLPQ